MNLHKVFFAIMVVVAIILLLSCRDRDSITNPAQNDGNIENILELPPPPPEHGFWNNNANSDNNYSKPTKAISNKPNISKYEISSVSDTAQIGVSEGWNLISVPVYTQDKRKESLFPSAISNAFAYDARYVSSDSLEPGVGYWLKFAEAETVQVIGEKILNITTNAEKGWNMIGTISLPFSTDSVKTNPQGIIKSRYFVYDASAGSYLPTTELQPGKGYWVKTTQAGEIIQNGGPELEQILFLENDVNINYSATISGVDTAYLKIFRNSETEPMLTRTIPNVNQFGTDFEEVFDYANDGITKGFYTAILGTVFQDSVYVERTDTLSVPNYFPTVNLSGLNINLDEEDTLKLTLPNPNDKNPEDVPVYYTSVEELDDKVSADINHGNSELTVQGNLDKIGGYSLKIYYGSDSGGMNSTTKSGTINNMLDIEGFLEDNEKHQRAPGTVKAYDESNSLLGEILVGTDGIINQQLPHRVSSLTNTIYIQGRRIENSGIDTTSYIRTLRKPQGDARGLEMIVVPYDSLSEMGITKEQFRRHVQEVISPTENPPQDANPNFYKWNFGEFPGVSSLFKEIIISKRNPGISNPADTAFFNQLTMDTLKNRILDSNDIGGMFRGKINDPNKIIIYDGAYPSPTYPNDDGRLVIYPSKYENSQYPTFGDYNADSYIDLQRIRVSVDSVSGNLRSPRSIVHEIGHGSGMWKHAYTLGQSLTIMRPTLVPGYLDAPRPADRKTAKIIYEDSYATDAGAGNVFLNGYRLVFNDVMSLGWK